MTNIDKAAQRTELLIYLGRLLAPLLDLVERASPLTAADYRIARARWQQDDAGWRTAVHSFVAVDGLHFAHEENDLLRWTSEVTAVLGQLAMDPSPHQGLEQARLRESIAEGRAKAIRAIDSVPLAWDPQLLGAETPLSACLRIRDAIQTAKRRLHYFDRYVGAEFFPLYLRVLDRAVEVRVITTKGTLDYGVTAVVDLSRLAAKEFQDFQLIECAPTDLHDRNLRVDDKIFALGASLAHFGRHPANFALGDSTQQAHNILDTVAGKGQRVV